MSGFVSRAFGGRRRVPCDNHCVTKWSKLGTSFRGVSVDLLLEGAEPRWPTCRVSTTTCA